MYIYILDNYYCVHDDLFLNNDTSVSVLNMSTSLLISTKFLRCWLQNDSTNNTLLFCIWWWYVSWFFAYDLSKSRRGKAWNRRSYIWSAQVKFIGQIIFHIQKSKGTRLLVPKGTRSCSLSFLVLLQFFTLQLKPKVA